MGRPLSPQRARRITRFWPVVSGGVALGLALALGAVVGLRAAPLEVDAEWLEEVVEHRSPLWDVPALVMNFVGAGWFGVFLVPVVVAVVLLVARRPWSAFYFVLATALSAGLVKLLKLVIGRTRPEDMLVTSDFGSFPSGHVANATVLAVALAILLQRRWVWIAGAAWVLLMMLSRTYLGAHWLSDTVGGALVGGSVAVLVWAPFAARLETEWRARTTVEP